MFRRNLTNLDFWNRAALKKAATELAANKQLNILVGPPSSGKTALIAEATKDIAKIHLDLRGCGTNDKASLVAAFRDSLAGIAEPNHDWAPFLGKIGTIVGASDAKEKSKSLIEILFGDSLSSPGDVVRLFDKTLVALTKGKQEVFVFIDEFSRLFSKGDPDKKWRDDFATDLEQVLIKHTKQISQKYVTAIITSSNQQYYSYFTELDTKKFAKTKYLGYMPNAHVLDYLENELSVKDEATREKLADYAGGHFTVLQDLATFPDPDAEIEQSKDNDLVTLQIQLNRLSDSTKNEFKTLIPELSESGFVSADRVSEKALGELLSHNVVSLRCQTKDTVWSPDLPEAAREVRVGVLTPFVPTHRHVLGDVQVK